MLLIYTPQIKPRLRYIFQVIFTEVLGVEYKLTDEKEHFSDFIGPKINYSKEPIEKELFFFADGLLIEKGIHPQKIEKTNCNKQTVIFAHHHPDSAVPFDPFAASFYLVSRYEEYLDFEPDKHGRFTAKSSIAYQSGFLDKPIVNIWAKQLFDIIKQHYPLIESHPKHLYDFVPTYDIDIAYSYLHKGGIRTLGGYFTAMRSFDFKEVAKRTKVLWSRKNDPYDTYDYINELHKEYELTPLFFFLLGEYGVYDKNIGTDRQPYRNLIQSISDHCEVGIHPSYRSNTDENIVEKEIKVLSGIIKKEVNRSRQHYIKLAFPKTYECLHDLEIKKEYSMGYPDEIGFRAGIASSYNFYLLNREMPIPLRIYPFCMMDTTFRFYKNIEPETALLRIKNMIDEVKKVNGLLMTVWHNHALSETDGWEKWRMVYEQTVEWGAKGRG